MSLNIGDNFSYLGAKPLDTRRVFVDKAAMDAVNLSTVYEGMVAYAQAEDKYYRLKSGVWIEFSSGSGGVSDWKANTAYAKNDMVVNGGKLYLCITAHTSGASFDTAEQANWQEVGSGGAGIVLWATNVKYAIGDIVYYANSLYRCNTAHTSSTFSSDSSNWDLMFADLKTWAGSTYYSVGTIAINGSKIYSCTIAHTSGLTFDSTEEANWQKLGGSGIAEWATSTGYGVGDIVYHNGSIFMCNTAHTSATFDLETANWDLMFADVKEWQINTYYVVGTVMIYDGELYKCITAHDSGSAFIANNFEKIYSDPKEMTSAEVAAMIANFNPSGDGLMQLDNWEANHGYTSKQVVYYSGDMYRCKTAHTSGATFDSTEEAFWDKIVGGGGTSIANWASGTNYAVGDFVIYNNKLYKCIIANTDTTFTESKWTAISKETEIIDWTPSTAYSIGDFVKYNNIIFVCKTAHTSSSTFTPDKANWDSIKVEEMEGATSSANGKAGGVPAPTSSDINKFLCGDGTWKSVSGGGLNIGTTSLWSGFTKSTGTLTLNDDIENYDKIIVKLGWTDGSLMYDYVLEPINDVHSVCGVEPGGAQITSNTLCYSYEMTFSPNSCSIVESTPTSSQSWSPGIMRIDGIKFLPNPNNYSTIEQEIGTWINGKPLYQKTFDYTVTATSSEIIVGSIVDSDKIVDIQCMFVESGSSGFKNYYPVSYLEKTSDKKIQFYDSCCAIGTSTGHDVTVVGDFLTAVGTGIYVTVKYTKTTD